MHQQSRSRRLDERIGGGAPYNEHNTTFNFKLFSSNFAVLSSNLCLMDLCIFV